MTCKRLAALALALCCLTSCASMLEREATYTAAHVENPPAGGDTGYRVNTYLALRSALRSYVEEGMTEGALRFPATYPGNLTVDLEKAKRQLMEEEPMGCYVLNDVTFHTDRIVAFYEVTATFDYRVSAEEFRALDTVLGQEALDERLRAALEGLEGGFTVRLELAQPPVTEETDLLADSLGRTLDAHPDLAVGETGLEVVYYPENAAHCVAEVKLTYPGSTTTLRLRRRNMLRAAQELAQELAEVEADGFYDAVMARWQLEPEGSAGADAALLDGAAAQKGLDRAFALVEQYHAAQREPEEGETP